MTHFIDNDELKLSTIRLTGAVARHLIELFSNNSPVPFNQSGPLDSFVLARTAKIIPRLISEASNQSSVEVLEEAVKETLFCLGQTHATGKLLIQNFGVWGEHFQKQQKNIEDEMSLAYATSLAKLKENPKNKDSDMLRVNKHFLLESTAKERKERLGRLSVRMNERDLDDFISLFVQSHVLAPSLKMIKEIEKEDNVAISAPDPNELDIISIARLKEKQEEQKEIFQKDQNDKIQKATFST